MTLFELHAKLSTMIQDANYIDFPIVVYATDGSAQTFDIIDVWPARPAGEIDNQDPTFIVLVPEPEEQ